MSFSRVWLFATSWTIAYQAPPSMGFPRHEYWSGLPLSHLLTLSKSQQMLAIWSPVPLLFKVQLVFGLRLNNLEGTQPHPSKENQIKDLLTILVQFSSVQFSSVSQSCPTLCNPMNRRTPGFPVHHQLPGSPKLMCIESVMPSSHFILCHPHLLLPPIPPSISVFSNDQFFPWGGQSIGVSALASVLPMNTQDWSPLEWTGWISLQSKGLSRIFSNTTVQKHQLLGAQLSL